MSRKIMSGMLTEAMGIAALSLGGAKVLDPAGEHAMLPALVDAGVLGALSNDKRKEQGGSV